MTLGMGTQRKKKSMKLIRVFFRFKSIKQVVQTIYKSSGPKGFVNGLGPTLVRAFPANAATFFAYEMAMECMSKY